MSGPVLSRAGLVEVFAAAMWAEAEETVRARLAAVGSDLAGVDGPTVRCLWAFLAPEVTR